MTQQLDPEAEVKAECERILNEAVQARAYTRPGHEAPPRTVYEAMVEVRGKLDTMEALRKRLIAIRASAKTVARERAADHAQEWDRKATDTSRTGTAPEYQGKEERYARWNLETLPEKRRARTAQRIADIISSTEEQVSASYFGLRDLQGELKESLRFLEWESSLER